MKKNEIKNRTLNPNGISELLNSVWILVITFILILILSLFYSSYYRINILEILSFQNNDITWVAHGVKEYPIIRQHYFGDFQIFYNAVKYSSPFAENNPYNNVLPFGFAFFKVLAFFPLRLSFLIYETFSLSLYFYAISLWFRTIQKELRNYRWKISFVLTIANIPIIVAVDRGAAVLLVEACFAILIYHLHNRKLFGFWRNLVAVIGFSFLISAKIYLLVVLAVLLFSGFRTLVLKILVFFTISNFISSFIFGGPREVFHQLSIGFSPFKYTSYEPLLNGISFSGLFTQLMSHVVPKIGLNSFLESYARWSVVPGVLYTIIILIIIKKHYASDKLKLIFIFSLFQYFANISYIYTAVWAGTALAILMSDSVVNKKYWLQHRLLYVFSVVAISGQMLFIPYISICDLIPSTIWFVYTCYILYRSLLCKKNNPDDKFSQKSKLEV